MKDYSGLLEIAEAAIGKNDDEKLRALTTGLQAMIAVGTDEDQQRVADAVGDRILELL